MRLTDLELDLLFNLVGYAQTIAYADDYGRICFMDDKLYIDYSLLNNYKSIDDFKIACNLLKLKLARG